VKLSRSLAAAVALLLLAVAVTAATTYARWLERRYVDALAPQMFAEKNRGVALQRAAFERDDLLPLYGSSDLNVPNPYHASALFRSYPTGFSVFPVGNAGSTSLTWLQSLAAVGCDLHGEKVAVSVSARLFMEDRADRRAYAANFSRLHANELAFSSCLDFSLKQEAARRMLQYPETLAEDALLEFAVERLARGSSVDRALYYVSWPLGKLSVLALRLRDHWETVAFMRAQLGAGSVSRQSADLDWAELTRRAQEHAHRSTAGNVFGFDSDFWSAHAAEITAQKGLYASAPMSNVTGDSVEWADLDLLLRVVRSLGAEALVLNVPMKGAYYDHLGVAASVRESYYQRLRLVAGKHEAGIADFAEHDSDLFFSVDTAPHLSAAGWVAYGRILDAFFNGRATRDPAASPPP
jgi:D-alanine transfer protein